MELLAIIVAVVAGFVVLKFISGMIKFAVLALVAILLMYFLTGGIGS
ncbi:MAG: hypothetical protein M3423_00460 [Actinomycetota bacterium]|nr:hypothetical protein [Actinomycetota bacterium]